MPFSKLHFLSLFASVLLSQRGDVGGTETPEEKKAREDKEAADKKAADDKEAEDFEKLPDWAKKQIKDLRKESAGHRTSNKTLNDRLEQIEKGLKLISGGEDETLTPEEKLKNLSGTTENLTVENTILSIAVDNGITKDEMKYFKFLLNERLEALGENEELDEDQLAEVVAEAKAKTPAEKKSGNSSVGSGQGGKGPKGNDQITVEQFKKMGTIEKSKLYQSNRELYNKLFAEAGV